MLSLAAYRSGKINFGGSALPRSHIWQTDTASGRGSDPAVKILLTVASKPVIIFHEFFLYFLPYRLEPLPVVGRPRHDVGEFVGHRRQHVLGALDVLEI